MTVFSEKLLAWYADHGRTHLPWRTTRDPYHVLVSEAMLQQTQVERVLPSFARFVELFPTIADLAQAERSAVIRAWVGLGYNSRAVRLHECARAVIERFAGEIPSELEALLALPGIGTYTAAALRAFAFELDDVALDTNLRRVIARAAHGALAASDVDARAVDASARESLPPGRAHAWNSAMMDLGATICTARAPKCLVCPAREACRAAPIDPARLSLRRATVARKTVAFESTKRYLRGRIIDRLRSLGPREAISLLDLRSSLEEGARERLDLEDVVGDLERDGLVRRDVAGIALY